MKVLGLLCELINDILLFFQRIEPQCECFVLFVSLKVKVFVLALSEKSLRIEPQYESFCTLAK